MDKELIAHIAQQLKDNQAPYKEGAWEKFSAKEQQKKPFAIWAAAAIILITVGIVFSITQPIKVDKVVSSKAIKQPKDFYKGVDEEIVIKQKKPLTLTHKNNDKKENQTVKKNNQPSQLSIPIYNIQSFPKLTQIKIETPNTDIVINAITAPKLDTSKAQKVDLKEKPTFEDILLNDSNTEKQALAKTAKINKWQSSVFVGPSIGNDNKLNLDYGLSISYSLAKNLAVNSGISYNTLSATDAINESVPQSFSAKSLSSVKANINGLNIPIELKYKISDKFYTGVGVSALAVLSQKQENNYITNQLQDANSNTLNAFNAGVAKDANTYIVKEQVKEEVANPNVGLDKYIGFYNFNFGYQQKVSKKFNIAIEPFLRVPMKPITSNNLNLTNGGLRLKVGF